jgi:chorismate mutase
MTADLPTAETTASAVASPIITAAGSLTQDEPAADAPSGIPGGRARIDAIDAELIALIRRRAAVSAEIQSTRIAGGGRRLDLSRETEVIGRYTRSLGRPGTSVAMALLEIGRGRV